MEAHFIAGAWLAFSTQHRAHSMIQPGGSLFSYFNVEERSCCLAERLVYEALHPALRTPHQGCSVRAQPAVAQAGACCSTARLAALLPGGPRVARDARVEVQVDVWSPAVVASHPNQHRLSLCLLLLSDLTA